jgi:TonB family protein
MNPTASSLTLLFALAAGTVPASAGVAISLTPSRGAQRPIIAATFSTCRSRDIDAAISQPYLPVLPAIAAEQGATGTTLVKIRIAATGSLLSSTVFATSGNPHIDRAALEAARASRYTAAVHECAATAASYLLRVDFTK